MGMEGGVKPPRDRNVCGGFEDRRRLKDPGALDECPGEGWVHATETTRASRAGVAIGRWALDGLWGGCQSHVQVSAGD